MVHMAANCPRCGTLRIAFHILQVNIPAKNNREMIVELFGQCQECTQATILRYIPNNNANFDHLRRGGFAVRPEDISEIGRITGHISVKDEAATDAPDHLPDEIRAVFEEGAKCRAIKCPNAAAAMFRLCLDLATKPLLPAEPGEKISAGQLKSITRSLGHRLEWMFENDVLPEILHGLTHCIKEDGNDGAHDGTVTEEDIREMEGLTVILLNRLYTEPAQVEAVQRRQNPPTAAPAEPEE